MSHPGAGVPTSFSQIERTWFTVREKYDTAYTACGNDAAAKAALTADRDGARDAYYLAVAKKFDEADAFVTKTKAALTEANKTLDRAIANMAAIQEVLKAITAAVQLAAALAAMAA